MKEELVWRPAIRVELVNHSDYPVTSVAFAGGWVFAKSPDGTVVFPASQVVKVALG
ncbi:hypothetical protein [Catenulispora subtropica]|uniref:Uncharacterized protein n=1 Tax=Catenulispora subtropica TaxID=450798 RepID=A0ABN2T659_9ACTN